MFEIPLASREELLGFAIFDEDWFMDELIATSKFSVIQLTETIEPEWFQFKDKAKKVIAEECWFDQVSQVRISWFS